MVEDVLHQRRVADDFNRVVRAGRRWRRKLIWISTNGIIFGGIGRWCRLHFVFGGAVLVAGNPNFHRVGEQSRFLCNSSFLRESYA